MIWEWMPLLVTAALSVSLSILTLLMRNGAVKVMQVQPEVSFSPSSKEIPDMSNSNTWIVRLPQSLIDSASYGDPVQCVVVAATPEEARKLGAELLKGLPHELTATPYAYGAGADDAANPDL